MQESHIPAHEPGQLASRLALSVDSERVGANAMFPQHYDPGIGNSLTTTAISPGTSEDSSGSQSWIIVPKREGLEALSFAPRPTICGQEIEVSKDAVCDSGKSHMPRDPAKEINLKRLTSLQKPEEMAFLQNRHVVFQKTHGKDTTKVDSCFQVKVPDMEDLSSSSSLLGGLQPKIAAHSDDLLTQFHAPLPSIFLHPTTTSVSSCPSAAPSQADSPLPTVSHSPVTRRPENQSHRQVAAGSHFPPADTRGDSKTLTRMSTGGHSHTTTLHGSRADRRPNHPPESHEPPPSHLANTAKTKPLPSTFDVRPIESWVTWNGDGTPGLHQGDPYPKDFKPQPGKPTEHMPRNVLGSVPHIPEGKQSLVDNRDGRGPPRKPGSPTPARTTLKAPSKDGAEVPHSHPPRIPEMRLPVHQGPIQSSAEVPVGLRGGSGGSTQVGHSEEPHGKEKESKMESKVGASGETPTVNSGRDSSLQKPRTKPSGKPLDHRDSRKRAEDVSRGPVSSNDATVQDVGASAAHQRKSDAGGKDRMSPAHAESTTAKSTKVELQPYQPHGAAGTDKTTIYPRKSLPIDARAKAGSNLTSPRRPLKQQVDAPSAPTPPSMRPDDAEGTVRESTTSTQPTARQNSLQKRDHPETPVRGDSVASSRPHSPSERSQDIGEQVLSVPPESPAPGHPPASESPPGFEQQARSITKQGGQSQNNGRHEVSQEGGTPASGEQFTSKPPVLEAPENNTTDPLGQTQGKSAEPGGPYGDALSRSNAVSTSPATANMSDLQTRLDISLKTIREQEENLNTKNNDLSKALQQVKDITAELEGTNAEREQWTKDKAALLAAQQDLSKQVHDLKSSLQESSTHTKHLEDQVRNANNSIKAHQQTTAQLRSEPDVAKKVTDREDQLAEAKRESDMLRGQVNGLEADLKSGKAQLQTQQVALSKATLEAADSRHRISELEDDLATARHLHQPPQQQASDDTTPLRQQISQLEAGLQKARLEAKASQAMVSDLEAKLAAAQDSQQTAQDSLDDPSTLRQQVSQLQADLDIAKRTEAGLRKDLQSQEDTLKQALVLEKTVTGQLREELAELRQELDKSASTEALQKDELKMMRDAEAVLKEKLQVQEAAVADLKASLEASKQEVLDLKGKIKQQISDKEDLQHDVERLRQDLETATSAKSALEGDKSRLKENVTALQAQLSDTQAAVAEASRKEEVNAKRIQDQQGDVERLKDEMAKKEAEMSRLTAQLGEQSARWEDKSPAFEGELESLKKTLEESLAREEGVKDSALKAKTELESKIKTLEDRVQEALEREQELTHRHAMDGDLKESAVQVQRELEDKVKNLESSIQDSLDREKALKGVLAQEEGLKQTSMKNKVELEEKIKTLESDVQGFFRREKDLKNLSMQAEARLKEKIRGLESSIQDSLDRERDLKELSVKAKDELEKEVRALESDIQQSLDREQALKKRLSSQEVEFEGKMEDLRKKVQDLVAREKASQQSFSTREAKFNGRIKELEKEVEDLVEREKTFQQSSSQTAADLDQQKADLEKQVQNSLKREKELEALSRRQGSDIEEAKALQAKAQESLDQEKASKELLLKQEAKLRAEVKDLLAQLKGSQGEVVSLKRDFQGQKTSLQTKADNLQHELQTLQEEHRSLQTLQDHAQERESSLNTQLADIKSQLTLTSNRQSELQNQAKQWEQRHRDQANQVSQQTQQAALTQKDLSTKLQLEKTKAQEYASNIAQLRSQLASSHQATEAAQKRADGFGDQLKQLTDSTRSMKSTIDTQAQQIMDKESRLGAYEAKVAKLSATIQSLEIAAQSNTQQIQALTRTNNALSRGDRRNMELMNQLQEFQDEVKSLNSKLLEKDILLEAQEVYVVEAQTAAWEKTKQAAKEKGKLMDDEEVESKFEVDVEARARQWGYKYSVSKSGLDKVQWTDGGVEELGRELGKITGAVRSDARVLCRRYDPDIIVHALLVGFVTEHILRKPFLLFELVAGQEFAERMVNWYEARLKADPIAAQKWRYSELLWLGSSLLPIPRPKSSRAKVPSPTAIPAILQQRENPHDYFTNLAVQFVHGPAHILLNETASSTASMQTLISLFTNAAQAGLMMWRSPLEIRIRGFEQLRGLRFPLGDSDGENARTHPSQLGAGSGRVGRNAVVDVVVQPGIVARQENGAEKVWSQAVVLWA